MTIAFKLENQDFLALNGGPHFTYSPAISRVVNCKTQREIDDLWRKLGAGGRIDPGVRREWTPSSPRPHDVLLP